MPRLYRPVVRFSLVCRSHTMGLPFFRLASVLVLCVVCNSGKLAAQSSTGSQRLPSSEQSANDCETALPRAEHAYEAGAFRQVIDILSPCLPSGMAEDDIWRGYRLEAISYLLLGMTDSGRTAIALMLRKNPTYEALTQVDPYEFQDALKAYTYYAQFSAGAFLELYQPKIAVLQANTISQTRASSADYSGTVKTNAGAEFLFHFAPRISVGTDFVLLYEDFARSQSPIRGVTTSYTENISSVALPVFARVGLFNFSIQPFVEAGGFGQWITPISAKIVANTAATVTNPALSTVYPDPTPDVRRQKFNYGWVLGFGATVPMTGSEIVLRGRYWNGLTDVTKANARLSDPNLLYPAYYVDDDIALRGFEFSIGVNVLFGFREYRTDD